MENLLVNTDNNNFKNNNIILKLLNKAEESYNYELNVYKNFPNKNGVSFPSTFNSFVQDYIINNNLSEFQKNLKALVYGYDTDNGMVRNFIDILHTSEVRNKLTRAGATSKKFVIDQNDIQNLAKDFRNGAFVVGQNSSFLEEDDRQENNFETFLDKTINNIIATLEKHPKAIEAYMGKAIAEFSEDTRAALAVSLKNSLNEQSFQVSAKAIKNIKKENGQLIVSTSQKESKKLPGMGRTIKIQKKKDGTEIYQMVPISEPLFEIQQMVDTQIINDQKQNIEFTLSLNMQQEQMNAIIKNALDNFSSDINNMRFLTVSETPDIEIEEGAIAIKYNSKKHDASNAIEMLIESYGEEVKESIQQYESEILGITDFGTDSATASFEQWFNGIKNNFVKIIEKNPHIQKEILKSAQVAQVSGTILGEVMYSLLASGGGLINPDKISILGQDITSSGQAAVDIKMSFGEEKEALKSVGFQIKTFPSVAGSKFELYGQSNRLADTASMRRYLSEQDYQVICDIFLQDIFNEPTVYSPSEENRIGGLAKAFNIFMTNIPSYIRYEQMDLVDTTLKNNFYIINYDFVPASVIFYCLAVAIYSQLISSQGDLLNVDGLFNFSYKYQEEKEVVIKGEKKMKKENVLSKSGHSFIESWNNMLSSEMFVKGNVINLDNIKKNLYINFEGVKIQFKENIAAWFNKSHSSLK